jgi:hypothetical protein
MPGAAVIVFLGVLGGDKATTKQVHALAHQLHLAGKKVPAATLKTLTHHGSGAREIVQHMHVQGAIGFEAESGRTLRVVVYDGNGTMKTFLETGADELDTLKDVLSSDVGELGGATDEPEAEPQPADEPAAAAPTSDEQPAAKPEEHESSGDAVDISEIEALTTSTEPAAPRVEHALHLGVSAGFGIAGRTFAPGPTTVQGYSSSVVGTVAGEAHVEPSANLTLAVAGEHTLAMSTPMQGGSAPTSMARWQATGRYALVGGRFQLAPEAGLGRRTFSIQSTDPSRSPDGDYTYAIAGITAAVAVTPTVGLRGEAAFEPVLAGNEATEMAFGPATRWGMHGGVALEVKPTAHTVARASADYQQFSWSWDMAGARGAGGATDSYLSAALTLGADY